MDKSILKDLVVGNLYQHVDTNKVFVLLEFEVSGGCFLPTPVEVRWAGSDEDDLEHVESWKIMIGDKIESWWMWKGSYRALECTSSSTEI